MSKHESILELYLEQNEVEYSRLMKVLKHFYDFIQDLTTNVAGEKDAVMWNVNVKEGSIRLLNAPYSDREHAHAIPEIYTCIKHGISILGHEATRPDKYTDSILRKLRKLASLKKDGINYKIKVDNDEIEIRSDRLIDNIDTVLSWKYEDYGSVEGKLQALSSRGELRFILYEHLTDKPVKCIFKEENLPQAIKAFNQRIYVFGLLRYNSSYDPVSILVQEMDIFPDDKDLPTFAEVKGILED